MQRTLSLHASPYEGVSGAKPSLGKLLLDPQLLRECIPFSIHQRAGSCVPHNFVGPGRAKPSLDHLRVGHTSNSFIQNILQNYVL